MSTSMQSSVLLSDISSSEQFSDSTEPHESPPEQKSGVIHLINTMLAARFGFFSPDSLKTVSSTFINLVPTEVVCMFFFTSCISGNSPQTALQQIRSTSLFRQSSGIDDRLLAVSDFYYPSKLSTSQIWQFQNGIKYMAYHPESRWTKSLQEVAIGHVLRTSWLSEIDGTVAEFPKQYNPICLFLMNQRLRPSLAIFRLFKRLINFYRNLKVLEAELIILTGFQASYLHSQVCSR